MPSIWIGFDPRETAAFAVARQSIRDRLTQPIPIHGLVLDKLKAAGLYTRPTELRQGVDRPVMWDVISEAPMATEFSNSGLSRAYLREDIRPTLIAGETMAPPVVDLPDAAILNRGRHRICFVHPDDPHRCIKVPRPGRSLGQCLVEHDYYRHLAERHVPLDHVAACHGWVETSRGRGLVFNRIQSAHGTETASVDLERAITTQLLDEQEIRTALRDLVGYLRKHRILWSDENPKNICVTRRPSLRFVIVEGLGGRTSLDPKYRVLESVPLLARIYTAGKIAFFRMVIQESPA